MQQHDTRTTGAEQARERSESAQERTVTPDDDVGAKLADAIRDGADAMQMTEFTEPSASAAHGHSPAKGEGTHDIRGAFNVDADFIREHFGDGVVPNGHEAVHYLLSNRDEFVAADESLFTDVPDDDAARWNDIRTTAGRAPIPPGRQAALAGDQ